MDETEKAYFNRMLDMLDEINISLKEISENLHAQNELNKAALGAVQFLFGALADNVDKGEKKDE